MAHGTSARLRRQYPSAPPLNPNERRAAARRLKRERALDDRVTIPGLVSPVADRLDALQELLLDVRYTLPEQTPPAAQTFDLVVDVPWLGRRLPVLGEVR